MSTLQNKIETINKELDIHKLMLGVWVIKEFTNVPSADPRIKFDDYNLYNYTITFNSSIGTKYGTTIQTYGFETITGIGGYANPISNDNAFRLTTYSLSAGLYVVKKIGDFSIVNEIIRFKVRKAPLDAYVREMIESKWYKEQYLKGKTPTFKTEMSVYDYYVNNIMEK